jgi:hypothetical protein
MIVDVLLIAARLQQSPPPGRRHSPLASRLPGLGNCDMHCRGPRACAATLDTVSANECIPSRDSKPDTYLAFRRKIWGILAVRVGKEEQRHRTCVASLPTRNEYKRVGSLPSLRSAHGIDYQESLLLDSRVVTFEDGVY